eukprot:SAG11_NODE_6933_length_1223_cov_1.728648_1_plen_112_part_10
MVHGAVYDLTADGFQRLDRHEGVPAHYIRAELQVTVGRPGCAAVAVAYVANEQMVRPGLRPRPDYLLHLLAGADILPEPYVATLRRQPTTTCAEQPPEPPAGAAYLFCYGTL